MTDDNTGSTHYPPEGWEEVPGGGLRPVARPSKEGQPAKVLELITGGSQAADDDANSGSSAEEELAGIKAKEADFVLAILRERYDGGVSEVGDIFAVPRDGARWARLVSRQGGELKSDARVAFFEKFRKVPQSAAITDGLTMFAALTQKEKASDRTRLHQRYARDGSRLIVDLGWADGQVVHIDATGWRVREQTVDDALFKRPRKLKPMPEPAHGDGFESFRELAHVDRPSADLMSAWLVSAMFPDHPQPMPVFEAPPGAGKTSLAAAMLSTLDPGAKLGVPPRADRSWEVVLDQSYGAGFDNLSYIGQDESDRLARAITGEETETRTLYTTDEITTLVFKPRLVATTIGLSNLRGDLANRMIPVELLPPTEFIDEETFAAMVKVATPKILGSMFDAASVMLRELDGVKAPAGFRMATFARLLAAFDLTQGTDVVKAYKVAQEHISVASLDSNRLWPYLAELIRSHGGEWTASASEVREQLLSRLRLGEETKAILVEAEGKSGRLRSPQTTGNLLTELSVSAAEHGWRIERLPHHGHARQWLLRQPQEGDLDASQEVV